MAEKKQPELDDTAKRALELHRVEGEMLRALAPLDPNARARAFAAGDAINGAGEAHDPDLAIRALPAGRDWSRCQRLDYL
jgi:hypothetical protein